ncbi:MAG: hypothetical protein D6705_06330 [Deltaproteobacteria bacterium]|nr:MAG: hypothetical protein D6705_06330 [Deltaproteobacteria bacterium]
MRAAPPSPDRTVRPLLEGQVSPVVGPHAFGNEACDLERRECVRTGRFFGTGASAELRLTVLGPLRLHGRLHVAGNVVTSKPLYRSVVVPAVGLGLYGHRLFGRVEVQHVLAFGPERFDAPFADVPAGSARWSRTAIAVAVGVRFPITPRIRIEPWGGYVAGPMEDRIYEGERERRWLHTFVAGIGASFALIDDPRRPRRARRRP